MKGCFNCFRPAFRWLKSPFQQKEEPRILEIGLPTNFRKEEFTIPLSDDDHGVIAEKEAAQGAVIERNASKRDQLKQHVRKLSAKLTA